MPTDRPRNLSDPAEGLPAPEEAVEPGTTVEDQFQRLEQARKSIEATIWYLEIEAPGVVPFRQGLLGESFSIGHDFSSNLPLQGEGVARQHARLEHDDEHDCWRVIDAGSEGGTFVNGRRVREPTLLKPEDTIHVGDYRLRLRADSSDEGRREPLRFATLRLAAPPLLALMGRKLNTKPDRLVVLSGPAPINKEIRLDEGPVRLGPVKGSSLVPDPGALAGFDVEVRPMPDQGGYELLVRGEGGPVFVNDLLTRKLRLSPGDKVHLGRAPGMVTLEFRPNDSARSSAPSHEPDAPPDAKRGSTPGASADSLPSPVAPARPPAHPVPWGRALLFVALLLLAGSVLFAINMYVSERHRGEGSTPSRDGTPAAGSLSPLPRAPAPPASASGAAETPAPPPSPPAAPSAEPPQPETLPSQKTAPSSTAPAPRSPGGRPGGRAPRPKREPAVPESDARRREILCQQTGQCN
jgi:FHA domain-containing protein